MEKTGARIGIAISVLSALHIYALAQAQGLIMATAMALGAPGPDNALRTLLGYAVLAYPVAALASLIATWILFARGRHRASLACALLPLAIVTFAAAIVLLSIATNRPLFG